MKTYLTCILFFFGISTAFSCSCLKGSFCNYFDRLKSNETTLIFKGSFIQEEDIGTAYKAVQYNVEEVYYGEIVTENSIHYSGETYINSESAIWVLKGSGAACLRWLDETSAIFIVTYNPDFFFNDDGFGYVPTICQSDYFPISSTNEITGFIWEKEEVTISLSDFETLINEGCTDPPITEDPENLDGLKVFPNPVDDQLTIESDYFGEELTMKLYDTKGRLVKTINSSTANLSDISSGMYFFIATYKGSTYTKKVVKI